jgi:hypothetical protein
MLVDIATARISMATWLCIQRDSVVYLFGRDTTVSKRAVTAERPRKTRSPWVKLSVPLPNADASIDSSNSTPLG